MLLRRIDLAISAVALFSSSLYCQSTTGTLLGTVSDPGDAAVPGAQVELRNVSTGFAIQTVTGPEGIFRFNSLAPATYDLSITGATGFKAYRQSRIDVTANEVRDLGKITLELGSLTEQVSVTATTSPIQTASSENSKLIDSSQMKNITLKGRDMFGMLVIVPGVAVTQRDTTSENTVGSVRINGAAFASANFTVDGITNLDTGSNGTSHYEPNMDAIAEMRVLTSNYQAEYGRSANGVISVVTRSGSQEFHGSACANKRHEMFNAKSFLTTSTAGKRAFIAFSCGATAWGDLYISRSYSTRKGRSSSFSFRRSIQNRSLQL